MAKRSRYSTKRIRRAYTYTAYEVADLFGVSSETVFRWIRDEGLVRLPGSRKYFVHGSDLAAFLERRNRKNKSPCAPGQIYCLKCRAPRTPESGLLERQDLPNGATRVCGLCTTCGTLMSKTIGRAHWHAVHPLHPDHTPPQRHIGERTGGRLNVVVEGGADDA
ncbi:MAG: helix-turn-helix domain-containing protein [Alphaproteobacteria bacterium]|jgi:hypothetical protein|nr:helix-turn-helix domain-containing protein [Alphaproteobacteria bacterium]